MIYLLGVLYVMQRYPQEGNQPIMRYEKWDISGFDRNNAELLCRNKVNPLISVLLSSRNITEPDEVYKFLNPKETPLHDPHLLTDMDKAVTRIFKAIDNNESIAIYGDYDVDGMTSVAMLAMWLKSKGKECEKYIPGRFCEGYGLHSEALDILKERGVNLVITVDCGITACEEALYAKKIGLDLIITDHHECKDELPQAVAVINPKREGCEYPFKSLAGVGVVYKLICALEDKALRSGDVDRNGQRVSAGELSKGGMSCNAADRYGQLVALGTVADVMPMTSENRRLILQGIEQINKNPIPGLKSLIKEVYKDGTTVTASTISFALAPRLNASGRMGDPMLSVNLLISNDSYDADQYVTRLCNLNAERRESEQGILDSVLPQLEEMNKDAPANPIVIADENWHQGVTGIVAAKIADRFRVPTIIICIDENGLGHGSCRSFGTFAIYGALCRCADILENFGGHEMAAGLTIAKENIDELRRRVTEYYNESMGEMPLPGLRVDFEVEKPERLLTAENIEALKYLEPFGRENLPPCLCIMGAMLTELRATGDGKHSKIKIAANGVAKSDGAEKTIQLFDCVFFSVTPEQIGIRVGDTEIGRASCRERV